jgi:hypothetical protein
MEEGFSFQISELLEDETPRPILEENSIEHRREETETNQDDALWKILTDDEIEKGFTKVAPLSQITENAQPFQTLKEEVNVPKKYKKIELPFPSPDQTITTEEYP